MITRLYIHNFRTLLNFEVQLKDFNLLIGRNGTGKTSILEVLGRLRRFIVDGAGVDDLYPEKDISTLASKRSGRFEIDVHTGGMNFRYEIEIAHDLEKKKSRIEKEVLLEDGNIIFENIMGEASLYNDSYGKGPSFPIDWSRSGLNVVMPRNDNTKLIAFKEYMGNVCVSRLNPMVMRAESRGEAQTPAENMEHFSDWYRYLLQAEPGKTALISQKLAPALPGFKYLKFAPSGDAKILMACFGDNQEHCYRFDELSDGQRVLIVLYSLIYGVKTEDTIVCIDEPENFLALPEVQPWLDALNDLVEEGLQVVLVSHHPKLINFLARDIGLWIYREGETGPTRIRNITDSGTENGGISLAALVERGWVYDF